MGNSKKSIVLALSKQSGASTNEDVISPKCHTTQSVCIQNISAKDDTSTCTQIDVGLVQGNKYYWINSKTSISAGVVYNFDNAIWFSGEYQVVVRFIGSTTGDNLKVWIYGYYVT